MTFTGSHETEVENLPTKKNLQLLGLRAVMLLPRLATGYKTLYQWLHSGYMATKCKTP